MKIPAAPRVNAHRETAQFNAVVSARPTRPDTHAPPCAGRTDTTFCILKQGFYPAPPEAIAGILRHLKIPDPPPDPKFKREDVNILDPCAGEAKALVQLAEGLGVSKDHVFAIELNASRAARIAEAYPDMRLLGPCSFEATRITRHSFSLVYLNPPFDDEFGGGGPRGGRVPPPGRSISWCPAASWSRSAPVNQVFGRSQMCELLDTWFDQLELYLFPDDCRSYRECVVFGRRRKTALTDDLIFSEGILTNRGISRCSAAPIAKLARLGEPQFSRWRYAEPDTASRKPELDTWELPFSVGSQAVPEDRAHRRGTGTRAGSLASSTTLCVSVPSRRSSGPRCRSTRATPACCS